jgi:hypothetical protein
MRTYTIFIHKSEISTSGGEDDCRRPVFRATNLQDFDPLILFARISPARQLTIFASGCQVPSLLSFGLRELCCTSNALAEYSLCLLLDLA